MLTLTKLCHFWVFFTSVPLYVKIDQEMRLWDCRQTDRCTQRCKSVCISDPCCDII